MLKYTNKLPKKIDIPSSHKMAIKKKSKFFDWAGYFPDEISAKKYSIETKKSSYHKDRLRALNYLTKNLSKVKSVLDFGIGDGNEFKQMKIKSKSFIGIDISSHMINLANENLKKLQNKTLIVGGVSELKKIKKDSVDLIIANNVLAYLNDKDLILFFKEIKRIAKKKCYFLTLNGNELFDLFALNCFTKIFFKKHFKQTDNGMNKLLKIRDNDKNHQPSRRFNPIQFKTILKKNGFIEIEQSFSQWHKFSPEIGKFIHKKNVKKARLLSRDHNFDPNKLSDENKWKALFCCTIFGSLSKRI